MAEDSIDRLSIEVSSNADAAVASLNNLVSALGNLESKVGSSATKMLNLSTSLRSLKSSLNGLNLSALSQLGQLKFSSTVPKNLGQLASVIDSLPADSASKLSGITSALSALKGVSLSKGTVDNLARLPQVFKEYEQLNMSAFASQIKQLNSQLLPLANNVTKLATAYKALPKSMQTAGLAARSVASANKYLDQSNNELVRSTTSLTVKLSNLQRNIALVSAAWQFLRRTLSSAINEVNTYIENMNLFEVSMGKYTQEATEYGQKIQDVLGIDFGEWARNQGVFMTLATGMGETAERASVMSKQLTQLGYDISSFYNIKDVSEAMLKLQSGLAGELEPLRRLGWDLSNARMKLEATKMGIEANVNEMTQAEKVGLRYHMIMTQVTQVHGDMARTIASPANQLRVFKAQITLCARAIGNLLIPALNAILPVAIAVVKAIRLIAESIAALFGIDMKFKPDYSSLDTSGISTGGADDLTDALDESGNAADKAKKKVKEYKNTVMGFDELNKLNAPPEDTSGSGSGSGGAGGGGGLDLPLETYDFLAGLKDNISAMTDEMAKGIAKLLPYVLAVAAGLAAWKIASAFTESLSKCLGIAMAVAGAVILVFNWLDAWNNGITFENLTGMLIGIGLLVGGLALAFGTVGAAIGAIVGGIALLVVGFKDAWENGMTLENLITVGIGGALLAIGLALTPLGAVGAAIGVIVGGIALLVLGFKDLMENGFSETNFAAITAGFVAIGAAIGFLIGGPIGLLIGAVVGLVAAIVTAIVSNWDWLCENIFSPIGSWIDTNVIQPVAGFFTGLWEAISSAAGTAWQAICDFFSPAITWFSELCSSIGQTFSDIFYNIGVFAQGCWTTITLIWQVVAGWFDQNVIQPVTNFFNTLWNGIKLAAGIAWTAISTIWNVVSSWFQNNIITPISNAFSALWNGVTTFASNAWSTICGIFSSIGSFFQGVYNSIWGGLKSIINSVFGGINSVLSWIFGGINNIIGAIANFEVLGQKPFAGLRYISVPQIPYLAEGRYGINAGQLFVARESGAEMVGSMNGHTTVANNQQIVEGIEAGVMSAMVKVMAMSDSSGGTTQIEIPLIIGNEEIARATWKGEASLVRRGELRPQFA